jgi:multiple sugar transport system ATP-binding protein
MNFLAGELTAMNGETAFRSNGFRYVLPGDFSGRLRQPRTGGVTLGIRPEAIDVDAQEHGAGWHAGTVYIEEPVGSDLFLTIDLQGLLIRARTTPDFQTGTGARVYVYFNPNKLHAFDAASGEALT